MPNNRKAEVSAASTRYFTPASTALFRLRRYAISGYRLTLSNSSGRRRQLGAGGEDRAPQRTFAHLHLRSARRGGGRVCVDRPVVAVGIGYGRQRLLRVAGRGGGCQPRRADGRGHVLPDAHRGAPEASRCAQGAARAALHCACSRYAPAHEGPERCSERCRQHHVLAGAHAFALRVDALSRLLLGDAVADGEGEMLFAQGFPDPTVTETVSDIERIAAGLSQKIWQKIIILEALGPEEEKAAVA